MFLLRTQTIHIVDVAVYHGGHKKRPDCVSYNKVRETNNPRTRRHRYTYYNIYTYN